MKAIRQTLVEGLDQAIPPGRPIAIADVPIHSNPGDLFIYVATLRYLEDRGLPVIHRSSIRDYTTSFARRRIPGDAVILSLGGGNFGDLYPRYQTLRERVVADFPDNPIVVLPQTIFYQSKENVRRSAIALRRHRELRLLVRDRPSATLARTEFTEATWLLPDMAHYFWPLQPESSEPARGKTLYLIRRDTESRHLPSSIAGHRAEFRDWRRLLPRDYLARLALTAGMLRVPGRSIFAPALHDGWHRYSERVFDTCIQRLGSNRKVVTDRLHAHLLALLLGRESDIVDNSYGKLSAYHSCWTANVPGARLLDVSGTQPGLLEATGTL